MPRRGLNAAAVVAVAADLADADGLEQLTLARLAERLGVSTPALYKHLDGVEGLKRELALHGLRELTRRCGRAAVGKSSDAAVTAIADAYRHFARAHPGIEAAARRAPPAGDDEWGRAGQELVEIVLAVFASFGLTGEDALHAVRGFRSVIGGFVLLETAGGFGLPLDLDESFGRLLRVFTAGLRQVYREGE